METNREIWRSGIKGTLGILKANSRGDLVTEVVNAGQTIAITTEDRLVNQEKAANADLDPFKNGMLVPVKLFDAEDAAEIAANPNLISESEMESLFKANWKAFDARIAQITNPTALTRMIEIAGDKDATVRQVDALKARLGQVSEKPQTDPDSSELPDEMRQFRPVTPL